MRDSVFRHVLAPIASRGPLAGLIGVLGLLAVVAWIGWCFGPTLARVTGLCSWWLAWACGSEGGYVYCAAFVVLGTLAWNAGTIWYAKRRGAGHRRCRRGCSRACSADAIRSLSSSSPRC